MQLLTKKTIKRILKKTQHVVDVEDFDLIEELDGLAEKVAGVSLRERRLLNSPFDLCGIKFYPLTVAKSLWYAEKVDAWEIDGHEQEALLFWLLSLPLTAKSLEAHSGRETADKACKKLSRKLHCQPDELGEVYRKCIGTQSGDSDDLDGSPADYGGMIACLIKEYGGTDEKWLYETPVEMIGSMFYQMEKRVIAEEDASRDKSASGGKAVAPTPNKSLASLNDFNLKAQEIEEKWSV